MGRSPAQVRAMSLWDFAVCCDAWRRAHDPDAAGELSDAELAELDRFLDEDAHGH